MGMFDVLYCDYPLPDPQPPEHIGKPFQTKSFTFPYLNVYRLTADGHLTIEDETFGACSEADLADYHGDIYFYDGEWDTDNQEQISWYEYRARFSNGKLDYIKAISKTERYQAEG